MGDSYELPVIPAGAVETERIVVRGYLNPDGSTGIALKVDGSDVKATYLGLLVMAQNLIANR